MSHTTQRRGIGPEYRGKELIVLAMIPSRYKNLPGIREAMRELALKMLDYGPQNWISRNFTEITYPGMGASQDFVNWMHQILPESTTRYIMSKVGSRSSVVTAVYTDSTKVVALISDLKKNWLRDVVANQLEVGLIQQVRHVRLLTGEEVVQADDVVAVLEQSLAEVGTDKTGSTCNQRLH